jgi:hypothetical protein
LNGNILFLHLLRKHWHHCFLAEFSKDDPDFFKEASSYNHLSPHKVISRSNLHFLHKYNLIISNDCGHLNVYLYMPGKFKTYLLNGNILFLHLILILMLRKHWHHCFLAEFSKDDYNHLSPHKVISRSNLHFLHKYNLIISNDCGHLNV